MSKRGGSNSAGGCGRFEAGSDADGPLAGASAASISAVETSKKG
eukprot:CAMPEP_0197402984 /NCGR_PEP_ID=MMETSP1165-20131217/20916_1 /TAXON_ID=284809 /ORGANISM="Chrysocystis fragilis, Strain CCMP3189" /LENGTH=43 /DNA_ID= /DNA_START= /DNA_END= /DNA_ORIENTATION=